MKPFTVLFVLFLVFGMLGTASLLPANYVAVTGQEKTATETITQTVTHTMVTTSTVFVTGKTETVTVTVTDTVFLERSVTQTATITQEATAIQTRTETQARTMFSTIYKTMVETSTYVQEKPVIMDMWILVGVLVAGLAIGVTMAIIIGKFRGPLFGPTVAKPAPPPPPPPLNKLQPDRKMLDLKQEIQKLEEEKEKEKNPAKKDAIQKKIDSLKDQIKREVEMKRGFYGIALDGGSKACDLVREALTNDKVDAETIKKREKEAGIIDKDGKLKTDTLRDSLNNLQYQFCKEEDFFKGLTAIFAGLLKFFKSLKEVLGGNIAQMKNLASSKKKDLDKTITDVKKKIKEPDISDDDKMKLIEEQARLEWEKLCIDWILRELGVSGK